MFVICLSEAKERTYTSTFLFIQHREKQLMDKLIIQNNTISR